jgi:hypothetical protein
MSSIPVWSRWAFWYMSYYPDDLDWHRKSWVAINMDLDMDRSRYRMNHSKWFASWFCLDRNCTVIYELLSTIAWIKTVVHELLSCLAWIGLVLSCVAWIGTVEHEFLSKLALLDTLLSTKFFLPQPSTVVSVSDQNKVLLQVSPKSIEKNGFRH